jgi:hypothetical protein
MAKKIAREAMTFADAPEFGQGDVAERPIAVPKVRSTNEIAAASTAPATTAPHSTKLVPAVEVTRAGLTGVGPTCVMPFSPHEAGLVKSKEAEDEQDDNHQADQIDDAVHW